MLGANPDHMHHIAQNKLKDNLPCICFKRHCQLLWLAYISKFLSNQKYIKIAIEVKWRYYLFIIKERRRVFIKKIVKVTWNKSFGLVSDDEIIVDNAPYLTFEDGTTEVLTNARASEIPGISQYGFTSNPDDLFIVEDINWTKVDGLIEKFVSENQCYKHHHTIGGVFL